MLLRLLLTLAAVSPAVAACTFTLSPASASFAYTSNDGAITVTASATNCARTAASNSSWITISLGQSGTGDGTVGYTVSQNNTTASRTGSLTVAGIAFNVTQAGAPCSYSLSPNNASVAAAGASGTFNVSTACSWTAASNADWISTSDAGTGNGAIHYTAAPNTGASRTGSISVGTQTFTVTQAGACTFTTTPVSAQADPNGASGTFTVTASATTCAWMAASNNLDFLTVTTGTSGTGNGTVGYTVASNVVGVARSGSISVANAFFSLFQNAGAGCSISLSIATASVPSTGGTGSFTVITNCPWTITSGADWVNIFPPASMTAGGSVAFSVTANTSAQARTAYLNINGLTFVIQQAGVPCTVSVTSASVSIAAGGGNGSIQVTAADGCKWSAASSTPCG